MEAADRPENPAPMQEGYYRLLIEAVIDYAIYAIDSKGIVTSWNAGAQRLKGYAQAEILGAHFSRFYTEEDRQAGLPARALDIAAREGRFENEGWRIRKDGTRFRANVVIDAIRGQDGALLGFAKVTRDLTRQKEAEQALEEAREALFQSQKMEAVGQLTGGLAHDFNNLLAGIVGNLELMQKRVAQARFTDLDKYIGAAQGAARRAASLTHRLLAFSRRQTLDARPTNVNRLIGSMEELIRHTVGPAVDIAVVRPEGVWITLVDPNQLENALLNLCINARDAMPDGGRVTIETANTRLDARAGRELDLPPGQYVALSVTDTGTGMEPAVMQRAFEPFFTTKPIGEGTGLGLSMIYGFARQSGGQVRIRSELGRGTTMCLYLPRHSGDEESAEAARALAQVPQARLGETVLVVDDEPTVRMLVAEVLQELGYIAIEAADAAEGLKVLQSARPIDLMITDVGLPGGMNGRQLADAGRALRPGLKTLFMTGYAEHAVIGNGPMPRGMQVMTKPFGMEALASRIKDIIEGDARAGTGRR